MKRWRFIGTGILAIGALAGAVWAATPTKGDMEFCNRKAAEVSKGTPVQPGAGTTGQPSAAPTTGSPQPGNNPTGGRMTDSSQPGTSPSALGMAPVGETDQSYRQTYVACITERTK